MTTIYKISEYETSKNYEKLADLMRENSVICIVCQYGDYRDVAHTTFSRNSFGGETFQVSARGIGYILAGNQDDFIKHCEIYKLEFIEPNLKK